MKKYYEENYQDLVKRYRKRKLQTIFIAIPVSFILGAFTAINYILRVF